MPKTLDTQGFSGLREEVVRLEGRPSRSPVLQEIIGCYDAYRSHPLRVASFFALVEAIIDRLLFLTPKTMLFTKSKEGVYSTVDSSFSLIPVRNYNFCVFIPNVLFPLCP